MTLIAFTRPERRLRESVALAESEGFTVMAAPSLEIAPCDVSELELLLRTVERGDIIVFTSATAAEECGRSPLFKESVSGAFIVSIGPGTAEALERLGVATDTMPDVYSSEGIVECLSGSVKGKRVVLLRSDRGSRALDRGLAAMGAEVTDFAVYSLTPADPKRLEGILEAGREGRIDVFAFTSPLSAQSFVEAAESMGIDAVAMLGGAKVAAIGKPTIDMLISLGVRVDVIPEKATFECMIAAVKERFKTE
ncbi:MAG: uroporphyrinogen-III synthase [Methanomassiliicoccaceae archaeon]|nr:uroporphyrinogen-III synthase [Methanomassiliicoccaceae archaeon]